MNFIDASKILGNPKDVKFTDAIKVATHFFGTPRIKGSHYIFKMPWPMDPRVNLQAEGNKAKAYQVRQLVQALIKLEQNQIHAEGSIGKEKKQENKK